MGTIMDLPSGWRPDFQPASFRGATFYTEVRSYECGQRLVIHEFPKRDAPYTENMGRRFYGYTVRGYIVQSARERDYRTRRDALQKILDDGKPGDLRLPWMNTKTHVICRQYRLTEEDRRGGYCVFDMQFVEASERPFKPTPAADRIVLDRALELQERTLLVMSQQPREIDRTTFVMDGHLLERRPGV
ncbi:MAG: hypothetical protein C5B60_06860 [Chloroflexi bacterium]|nr:MAG: hypothetical protein C5B60_06860 [Chloroflexota bacterium]